jgi:TDG/mug DNA glycosylase family protein
MPDDLDLTTAPPERLPERLAELHRRTPVGTTVAVRFPASDADAGAEVDVATGITIHDLVVGAGFSVGPTGGPAPQGSMTLLARERTLADRVGPGMRLLVCGLNPSLYSADAGVGFARPGNRFWPAALAAGLVTNDRDPGQALATHGVGMTDLVKRATARADELTAGEYRQGLARVSRLVGWLRPGGVCFVGLAGWRVAVDRRAVAGPQTEGLAGISVYVMPSTSGLNAHQRLDDLTAHLRAALALIKTR